MLKTIDHMLIGVICQNFILETSKLRYNQNKSTKSQITIANLKQRTLKNKCDTLFVSNCQNFTYKTSKLS